MGILHRAKNWAQVPPAANLYPGLACYRMPRFRISQKPAKAAKRKFWLAALVILASRASLYSSLICVTP
jgi:hypothetical protein